jgi:uncharacterized protein
MATSVPPDANLLGGETSPYLLQHKDNPVHWRPWGQAALAEAQASGKPILLSVGYAACHWCHVMAHESFEDDSTADLMNELFVNIKVDREERPDIDAIYMNALHLMGEQGGWPLTMFLTPDGRPFWGGTYFPPTSRWGRPAFKDLLRGVANAWNTKRDDVQKNVATIADALRGLAQPQAGGSIAVEMLDKIAERLVQEIDSVHGGIGGAPKFPQPAMFELLWRAHRRKRGASGDEFSHAVTLTLDRMCQGGIYDHLGGGFARYSVDAHWLVPHFEKMLYDNAQLIALMTLTWPETGSRLHAARVAETVAWADREMTAEGDAFAASLDADSEGEEGKFYVWTAEEIDAVLGKDAPLFKLSYDVTSDGNWEGHTILNRSKRLLLGDEAHELKLAGLRGKLFAARSPRVRPGRDDKVLADWNGLMIAAMARAGFTFGRSDWTERAQRAFAGATRLLSHGDGRLGHSYRLGRLLPSATLDDYAMLSRAALALHETAGTPGALDRARGWVAIADKYYWDKAAGGYFFTAEDASDLIARTKHAQDNATPSGNGVMAEVLIRLYLHTGESAYRDRAEATIAAFAGELGRNFFPLSTLLNAAELVARPLQVAIIGTRGDKATEALLRAVAAAVSLPNLVLQVVEPSTALPASHPAAGKTQRDGKPTAYVCDGPVCSAPIAEADVLSSELALV